MDRFFTALAARVACVVGSHWSFILASGVVLAWAITGPIFGFSDTWQLVINTGTTIVTFLMVFLIQNTQNRDATALHLKLDELMRATKGARNELMDLEDRTTEELAAVKTELLQEALEDVCEADDEDDRDRVLGEVKARVEDIVETTGEKRTRAA